MDPQNIEILRLRQEAVLKREEIQADVKKVIYGTFLLGVAVALFPVISGYIEHSFNLKIEKQKQVNALALQTNQLSLDLKKIERENQLAVEAARSSTEQSDRRFFEDIADEARSARLSDRITIAEFFAFVARDDSERDRWTAFLTHLKDAQVENNTRRSELLLIMGASEKSQSEREAAARELAQIDERENGVIQATPVSKWEQLVAIPDSAAIGASGLSVISTVDIASLLGVPREASVGDQGCQQPDTPRLVSLIQSRDLGPFSTALISPALDSLDRVMQSVKTSQPDLYKDVGSFGSICVRLVRGSRNLLSKHSWGTAIDVSIGGKYPILGSTTAPAGTVELAKHFAKEGWVWGGHFPVAEPGHFEVSAEKLAAWNAAGLLNSGNLETP